MRSRSVMARSAILEAPRCPGNLEAAPLPTYNPDAMPKRRVPGHLQRRARRRDDARPNIPPASRPVADDATAPAPEAGVAPQPASVSTGRPLRPTQRMSAGTRFARSAAPPPELEVDYRAVVG